MFESSTKITEKKGLWKNSPFYETFRLFFRNPTGVVSVAIIAFFIGMAIFGPKLAPYNPNTQYLSEALLPPSSAHLFGTDQFGRDILSRVLYAVHLDLSIAFTSVIFSYSIGVGFGILAGYMGKITDNVIMRFMDILFSFPGILFAIALSVAIGPSFWTLVIAIIVVSIPSFARVARSTVLATRNELYVTAAISLGAKKGHVMIKHVLPVAITPTIVLFALNLGAAIIVASSLSFLGVGIRPPTPELGAIITNGYQFIVSGQWWISVFPGILIVLIVIGFNMMGDAIREVTDVTLRR